MSGGRREKILPGGKKVSKTGTFQVGGGSGGRSGFSPRPGDTGFDDGGGCLAGSTSQGALKEWFRRSERPGRKGEQQI